MTFEKATIDNTTDFAGFLITLAQITVRGPQVQGESHRIEALTAAPESSTQVELILRVISSYPRQHPTWEGLEWTTGLNITLGEAPPGDFGRQSLRINAVHTVANPAKEQVLDRWQASDRASHFAAVEQVIAALETTVEALRINKTVVTTAVPQGD